MARMKIAEAEKILQGWAEKAAIPFQGVARLSCEAHLRMSMGVALRHGMKVFPEFSGIKFAYSWDDENNISVVMDMNKVTKGMLILGY